MGLRSVFECLAVCPPGIEHILAGELRSLGFEPKAVKGGAEFRADLRGLYLANLWLRTATRVLVRIARFRAEGAAALRERLSRIPWEIYLPPGIRVRIRASSRRSPFFHTGWLAQEVLDAACQRLGAPILPAEKGEPEAPHEEALLVVRAFGTEVLIRADSSGAPLYERGWREHRHPAPIRETLAAASLLAMGWDGREPLFDPFAGSGTIAIEAASLALGIPPGWMRDFGFERWRVHDPELWEGVRRGWKARAVSPRIYCSDENPEAAEAARAHAALAGVAAHVTVRVDSFWNARPPKGSSGLVLTNPPYGRRLQGLGPGGHRRMISRLERVFRRWRYGVILPERIAKGLRPELRAVLRFSTGGIKVALVGGGKGQSPLGQLPQFG